MARVDEHGGRRNDGGPVVRRVVRRDDDAVGVGKRRAEVRDRRVLDAVFAVFFSSIGWL